MRSLLLAVCLLSCLSSLTFARADDSVGVCVEVLPQGGDGPSYVAFEVSEPLSGTPARGALGEHGIILDPDGPLDSGGETEPLATIYEGHGSSQGFEQDCAEEQGWTPVCCGEACC